jgi:hypothetical protein
MIPLISGLVQFTTAPQRNSTWHGDPTIKKGVANQLKKDIFTKSPKTQKGTSKFY